MPVDAAKIRVIFDAGTRDAVDNIEALNAKIKTVGGTSNQLSSSMGGARREITAASSSVNILEGKLTSSNRALSRFLVDTLKLGPALNIAFPLIGIIALGAAIVTAATKFKKFMDDIADAPRKIDAAFRPVVDGIVKSNDELQLSIDKSRAELDKLEGKRVNNLKIILDEAKIAADSLEESLNKIVQDILRVQKENSVGTLSAFFTGRGATGPLEDQAKKFSESFGDLNARGQHNVRLAAESGDAVATAKAQADWNKESAKALDDEVKTYQKILDAAQAEETLRRNAIKDAQSFANYNKSNPNRPYESLRDQTSIIKEAQDTIKVLNAARDSIQLTSDAASAKAKVIAAQAKAGAESLTKPYDDKILELNAKLKGLGEEAAASGGPEYLRQAAKALAEVDKEIGQIDKERNKPGAPKPKNQALAAQVGQKIELAALIQANNTWRDSIYATNIATEQRIESLNRLTEAIGKGYQATKRANIENDFQTKFAEKLKDPSYANSFQRVEDESAFKKEKSIELDAEQRSSITETQEKIKEQIQLEYAVAAVRNQGEFAVKQAELTQRILNVQLKEGTSATKDLVKAMKELNQAQAENEQQVDLGRLGLEADALTRLTKATLSGADAIRQANLQKQITENVQKYGVAGAAPINARAIGLANEQYQLQLAGIAIQTDKAKKIDEEIQNLERVNEETKKTLGYQIALRDLQNQRLKAWADELLEIGTLKSGIQAFFLSMEEDAKKPGVILYEGLHDAVSKTADELTKLFTGQKASFGKLVQSIGVGILRNTIQSGLQTAIGAIGRRISHPAPVVKGPLGTYPDPFYVWVKNMPGDPNAASGPGTGTGNVGKIPPGTLGKIPPPSGGGGGGTGGTLGRIFGGILGGIFGGPQQGRASGGDVSPGGAYVVGERGPEPFFAQTSGTVLSNDLAKRVFGGGGGENGFSVGAINVNGADPALTRQSIFEALSQVHQDSISQSVKAGVQRSARVPPGR